MSSLPALPSRAIVVTTVVSFFCLAFLVYGPSLDNGFVRLDDGLLIYQNPAVTEMSFASLRRAFTTYDPELYIPLTLLSYQFDNAIGGGSPYVFHLHNLVLHILNALFVCWFVFLLFQHRSIALLIGLVFLAHPLHTEAVAWASGRKDVLATLYFLCSIIAFMYWRDRQGRFLYWLSVVLFLCGLLAKVVVLTLPLVLLLLLFREQGRVSRKDVFSTVPFFFLSVVFGLVAMFGKKDVNEASTLAEKVLMGAKSSVLYIQKLVWPTDLSVLYPFPEVITITSPHFYVPVLALVAAAGLILWSMRFTREVVVWAVLYLLTLAPTFINIAKGGEVYSASDRYAYIPSIGILCLGAYGLVCVLERQASPRTMATRERFVGIAGVATVAMLTVLSSKQSLVWRDSLSLFEHAIAHAPFPSHVALNNLGNAEAGTKKYNQAVEHFQESLKIRPYAQTYANLGATYRRMGRFVDALKAYDDALALEPDNALAVFGRGIVYAAERKDDLAFAAYAQALDIRPDFPDVYINIGALRMERGEIEQAIEAYQQAIAIDPYASTAFFNLGVAYTKQAQTDEAIAAYERSVDLNPQSIPARINLGVLYSRQARNDESAAQFRAILRMDPDNAAALSALKQLGEL